MSRSLVLSPIGSAMCLWRGVVPRCGVLMAVAMDGRRIVCSIGKSGGGSTGGGRATLSLAAITDLSE